MNIRKKMIFALMVCCLPLAPLRAEEALKINPAIEAKSLASLSSGAKYLMATQKPDGSWGRFPHPAIVSLCAMAVHDAPGLPAEETRAVVNKALDFVLEYRQDDGAIYPAKAHKADPTQSGNYPNYTTAIALLCLATIDRPQDREVMIKARNFLKSIQFRDRSAVDYGGIGYGKTQRADLSNLSWAAEALFYTEHLDREPYTDDPNVAKENKEMWDAMQEFLTKVQNLPETNKQPYVNEAESERGGFMYRPFESKASPDGVKENLLSSGSMTYAGLKSMLHARMNRDDIRVRAAIDYAQRNYTLDENPGMGLQGLYYYLHIMTKALDTYGITSIRTAKGTEHNWREEILQKFMSLQNENGSWANTHGRYFESLPELATPYAVIAMKIALGRADLKEK